MILKTDNRNKNLLLGGASALGIIWLFFAFIIAPLNERSDLLDRKIEASDKQFEEIVKLADDYIALSSLAPARSDAAGNGRSLSAEVERISRDVGVQGNIKRMAPLPSLSRTAPPELAVTMTDISLPSLVDFLERLYTSPLAVNGRRADIKTGYDKRDRLEIEMTLVQAF